MNIFYLDPNPRQCARYHCDKHVVKMILETAQLLSTAHRVLDEVPISDQLYRSTHVNHPSSIWVRKTSGNYEWALSLFEELCIEYTFRYNREHATETKLACMLTHLPVNIEKSEFTVPPQCMPEDYRGDDVVEAYRRYYRSKTSSFELKWTDRPRPTWF